MSLGIIGTGRLGICMALCFEKAGFVVYGIDNNKIMVEQIKNKSLTSFEPGVNEMLKNSEALHMVESYQEMFHNCDIVFVVVPTPSLPDGSYNHQYIEDVVQSIMMLGRQEKEKILVISCTTMPEYCESLQNKLLPFNIHVCYNPEFIAQGNIIEGFTNPDIVLIGARVHDVGKRVAGIYHKVCNNCPRICEMSLTEAEITKISLNCFVTMKISYANMIGDLVKRAGGNPHSVLQAIGNDARIGLKCLGWGYGYGGPCFPRDNIALQKYGESKRMELHLSRATDVTNEQHLQEMLGQIMSTHPKNKEYVFDYITYKPNTIILEQSFPLKLALALCKEGYCVRIKESSKVIDMLKEQFGSLFIYEECEYDV